MKMQRKKLKGHIPKLGHYGQEMESKEKDKRKRMWHN